MNKGHLRTSLIHTHWRINAEWTAEASRQTLVAQPPPVAFSDQPSTDTSVRVCVCRMSSLLWEAGWSFSLRRPRGMALIKPNATRVTAFISYTGRRVKNRQTLAPTMWPRSRGATTRHRHWLALALPRQLNGRGRTMPGAGRCRRLHRVWVAAPQLLRKSLEGPLGYEGY